MIITPGPSTTMRPIPLELNVINVSAFLKQLSADAYFVRQTMCKCTGLPLQPNVLQCLDDSHFLYFPICVSFWKLFRMSEGFLFIMLIYGYKKFL